jgi:hypothetical protein
MLFIPDYVIKYEIIKSLNAEPASELRFYTLFLPDPTLTLMVDSKSHITRYPLVFNRNCIATGKIKLQQYDTVYVYFPYQGYTMNIEVIAVEPEPISCVIDPTTYLKFKSDGCKYSLPVLDSILEPVSILTVPRPKFANIANLVAQTFVNLELPIPLIPITPPNIPQSLKLPTIKYTDSSRYNLQQRQEIREIKNISRIEDMGILNQIQTGGILSLTVSNNGEFLDLIPNDVMGYTSIFNMGNVILGTGATGGSNGDDAIVNFRTGGTPPGYSVQPINQDGSLMSAVSSIITVSLHGISGTTGYVALQYNRAREFANYQGTTGTYSFGQGTDFTRTFNIDKTADVRLFVNSISPPRFKMKIQYPPGYALYPLYYFREIMNGNGRDVNGTLFANNIAVPGEGGYSTRADLEKYLLTYAFGSPYYTQGSMGYISNTDSWKDAISIFPALNFDGYNPLTLKENIIIVNTRSPVRLSSSLDVGGIVVRNGGILLIDDVPEMIIRTKFILVESGGLLQAGSDIDNKYRYKGSLKILLTNDSESSHGIPIVSQYSGKVYFPGGPFPGQTGSTGPNALRAPYTGSSMNGNMMGGKCVAVGFNGNLQLCGNVPISKQYKGTWGAKNSDGSAFVDNTTLMTYFDGNNQSEKDKALLNNIETEYSNTWCQLLPPGNSGTGIYEIGSTRLYLKEDVSDWPVGSKIVITCRTDKYTAGFNPSEPATDINGIVPIWLDHDDVVNRTANQQANNKSWPHQYGVEVATIAAVSGNIITIREGLKFRHNSTQTPVTRTINGVSRTIYVDTYIHVGLLTRNILITPEYNSDPNGMGCNMPCNGMGSSHHMMCTACNYDNTTSDPNTEIYNFCYADRDNDPNYKIKYCNNQAPSPAYGHWMFGSSGLTGCNAISGGQTIFRYGSSVKLDGVELKYMGIPANFGTVAQYAIHFHLAGFVKSFTEYLQSKDYTRDGTIINCSNWCAFSRWVTLHGSHEVNIKNNIGFISMGSGYFIEDGIEINNTFEHNMAICTLPARFDPYYNPTPIYPNVASDLCFCSSFWFKNNKNRCFRNVACNSPQPVCAIWAVPQHIGKLRGPSTICLGDETLGLPGLIGEDNAIGRENSYLSQNKNNNADGNIISYSTNTPCWMPDNLRLLLYSGTDRCTTCSVSNNKVPYLLFAENIIYQMAAGMSEFPEALSAPLTDYNGNGGAVGCGFLQLLKNNPQFIPSNGQNTCTDGKNVAQVIYFETTWGAESDKFPYQPISANELAQLDAIGATTNQLTKSANIPKIFSNFLTFNLGPSANGLWGGSGWVKQTPAWLISCCLLQTGGGENYGVPGNPNIPQSGISFSPTNPISSTLWSTVCGDNISQYPNIYHVMYNHITDGALGLPPNPTLMGGEKMFIGDTANIYLVEYVIPTLDNTIISVSNNYFIDNTWRNIPNSVWTRPKLNKSTNTNDNTIYYGLFDFNDNTYAIQYGLNVPGQTGIFQNGQNNPSLAVRKYPYVSGPDFNLLRSTDNYTAANPQWENIVVNSQVGTFINKYGIELGNKLCKYLAYIPKCSKGPWELSGNPHDGFTFASTVPPNCSNSNIQRSNYVVKY